MTSAISQPIRGFTTSHLQAIFLMAVAMLALAGCGSSESANLTVEPKFESLYTNLFKPNCVQCHAPGTPAYSNGATLDFNSKSSAYTYMSGFAKGAQSASCSSVRIARAGEPDRSYLAAVLIEAYNNSNAGSSGCTPYPLSIHNVNLSSSEQSAIVTWIQNGAHND